MNKFDQNFLEFAQQLKTFHLDAFRPLQKEVIEHIAKKQSAFVIMPTGSGKSLTYQLPATFMPNLTLVISPLKALMKDQVDKLEALNIPASFINSDLSREEKYRRLKKVAQKKIKILYVTPERFRKTEFLEQINKIKISLLVIDEAHCISQWGHDFRPEYSRVGEIQKKLALTSPDMKTMALTATATAEVEKDILNALSIPRQNKFSLPISRPNLAIKVNDIFGIDNKISAIIKHIRTPPSPQPTIIYFSLIKTLEVFSQFLTQDKVRHVKFHSDLKYEQRKQAQDVFLQGHIPLILATPAFGLGIDKPDIRSVIHTELPGSIEAYFQEIGRAGRDGKPAECLLLYDEDDISTQMEFIKWSNPDGSFLRQIFQLIKKNQVRVRQEGTDFLRQELNFYNNRDFRAETAVNLLRTWDLLDDWNIIDENIDAWVDDEQRLLKLKRQNEKLLKVVLFAKSDECRAQLIYKYFDQIATSPCGLCDNCQNDKST